MPKELKNRWGKSLRRKRKNEAEVSWLSEEMAIQNDWGFFPSGSETSSKCWQDWESKWNSPAFLNSSRGCSKWVHLYVLLRFVFHSKPEELCRKKEANQLFMRLRRRLEMQFSYLQVLNHVRVEMPGPGVRREVCGREPGARLLNRDAGP